MGPFELEHFLIAAQKRAVLEVLHTHLDWTIGDLFALVRQGGPRSEVLANLTLRELIVDSDGVLLRADDGGPVVDLDRLERAEGCDGETFDEFVRQTLEEVGFPVGAAFLRARVGGPRWKLLASLRRLGEAKVVKRTGMTNSTRYQISKRRRRGVDQ